MSERESFHKRYIYLPAFNNYHFSDTLIAWPVGGRVGHNVEMDIAESSQRCDLAYNNLSHTCMDNKLWIKRITILQHFFYYFLLHFHSSVLHGIMREIGIIDSQ